MELIDVNIEESNKMAKRYGKLIKRNECYNNIAEIILNPIGNESNYDNLLIAFGGFQAINGDKLYSKHAFFILDNKAIDPTLALTEIPIGTKYVIIEKMNMNEYREYLSEHRHTFPKDMMYKLNKASLDLLNEDIVLIG